MKNIILLAICTIFWSCSVSEADRVAIDKVWKEYYSYSSSSSKLRLVSEEFQLEYMKQINAALFENKQTILKKPYSDKLNIMMKRMMIDSFQLKPDEIDTFEKAFLKIEQPGTFLVDTNNGFDEIIFESKTEAYVFFKIFLSFRCNHFIKEDNQWKINPYKEHVEVKPIREEMKVSHIQLYGSEESAIEKLLESAFNKAPNWDAPFKK